MHAQPSLLLALAALGVTSAVPPGCTTEPVCPGRGCGFPYQPESLPPVHRESSYDTPTSLYATRSHATPPTAMTEAGGFFIADGRLYDADGGEFVIRGINNPHAWFDDYDRDWAYDALESIAGYGFNTVRIVWETDESTTQLQRIIERTVELRMIPMIELHDVTGDESGTRLRETASYFLRDGVLELLQEHRRHLLLNVANEWSGDDWYDEYAQTVDMLRDGGLDHTLVIDANGWGQNAQVILDDGQALLDHDPEHNLLFSVHMYESYDDVETITETLEAAVDAQLPLIVGEFGWQHGHPVETIDFRRIMADCERLGLGYVPWSWKGNNEVVEYLDMSHDWGGNDLTEWGRAVIYEANGINATSHLASVFAPEGGEVPEPVEPVCPSFSEGVETGALQTGSVVEASGLAASRQSPGVLWTHNDSGDGARIFAVDTDGRKPGTFGLAGADAIDYEDIAIAGTDLFVGDIGDNAEWRDEIAVYRVAEPWVDPAGEAVSLELATTRLRLRYPDRAHNAETLLADPESGDLFIVTKEGSGNSRVFRAPAPHDPAEVITLDHVATLPFASAMLPGNRYATGGDVSPNGDGVLLTSYDRAFYWPRPLGEPLWRAFDVDPCPVPRRYEPQGEAIAFTSGGDGYYTVSEGQYAPLYLQGEDGGIAPPVDPGAEPEPDPGAEPDPPAECVPQCGAQQCGADPVCGQSCGACNGEDLCDGVGACIGAIDGAFILRNDYQDDEIGSYVQSEADALRVHHRQWGRQWMWVINTSTPISVVAGDRYRVRFEFADAPDHPVQGLSVGLTRGWTSHHPQLLDDPVWVPSPGLGGEFGALEATITASESGPVNLAIELYWGEKPPFEIDAWLRDIRVSAAP
ncbi:MAG: cellulase family glycosylhydrolase [Myxococcota bacterium]